MIDVRRVLTHVEDIFHEFGPPPAAPLRRGAAVAVIGNPYAGAFVPDIAPFMEELKPLGLTLARQLIAALGCGADGIQGYGKAAIVGAAGELEHGALWHVPGGYGMREALGWKDTSVTAGVTAVANAGADAGADAGATAGAHAVAGDAIRAGDGQRGNALAIVPSTKKVGAPGTAIDVPLTHVNASYVRSHLDSIEVRVPGAPAADEVAYILAMSLGPRIHERLGGLRTSQIRQWDGQR
jgi:hypothetical protein